MITTETMMALNYTFLGIMTTLGIMVVINEMKTWREDEDE